MEIKAWIQNGRVRAQQDGVAVKIRLSIIGFDCQRQEEQRQHFVEGVKYVHNVIGCDRVMTLRASSRPRTPAHPSEGFFDKLTCVTTTLAPFPAS